MLKYFKRQKSRRTTTSMTVDDVDGSKHDIADSTKRHSLRSSSSFCDEFLEELACAEEAADAASCLSGGLSLAGVGAVDEDIFRYYSRLSMTLPAIVNEPNCLSYFVQYSEAKNALPLIKFYLDTENFKTAAVQEEIRVQKQRENTASEVAVATEQRCRQTENKDSDEQVEREEQAEENKSVPELKTLCDLSMRKSLTDDEKCEIYAETNKQMNKGHHHHNTYKNNNKFKPPACAERISAASIKDAIAIYQKYLIANATHFVYLPVSMLSQISLVLCKRSNEQEDAAADAKTLPTVSASCFDEAQQYVLQQLERDYLLDFLQSTFYCKYCVELIEGAREERLNIYDLLYSEVTLFYFMEFLEQQGDRECLDFWTAAINYRKSCSVDESVAAKNDTDAQSDAMIIYDRFFSLQSDCRLWLSDKLRSHVEQSICALDVQVVHCFDLALQVTAKYLDQKYFHDFLKSQLFENYLNELKTKINEELCCVDQQQTNHIAEVDSAGAQMRRAPKLATRHRKTLSDCTNESSRSIGGGDYVLKNTLLAMDTSHHGHHTPHLKQLQSATNLNIDSRQLTNPNLLWHRATATAGGLKFGRVNALGRYERDFDVADACCSANGVAKHNNWTFALGGSKIKNAVRKLVNLPEDKVQEEIAWQVAEMIVKDVTSVTLCNGK